MDKSDKWNHMMCDLSWLTSFTWHNVFKVHPHRSMYPCFVPFYGQVTVHRMGIPHFIYPFVSWWTLRLFPLLWMMLLGTFTYKFLCGYMFFFLLGIVPGSEILSRGSFTSRILQKRVLLEMCWCCRLVCPVICLFSPSSPPTLPTLSTTQDAGENFATSQLCDLEQTTYRSLSLHFLPIKWG